MNAKKAKEIIDLNIRMKTTRMPPDVEDALVIGKEAIEDLLARRAGAMRNPDHLLPHETKGEQNGT